MENRASFDLTESLRRWRESLAQSPGITAENIRELETHLMDSMSELRASGTLSEEEAFLVVTRRMGSPEALAAEFSQVNTEQVWLERVMWIFAGYLLISMAFSLANLIVSVPYYVCLKPLRADPHSWVKSLQTPFFMIVEIGLLWAGWKLILKKNLEKYIRLAIARPIAASAIAIFVPMLCRALSYVALLWGMSATNYPVTFSSSSLIPSPTILMMAVALIYLRKRSLPAVQAGC